MKAWETKPAHPSLVIFFRPMSLQRWKRVGQSTNSRAMKIAPKLSLEDIFVTLDGKAAPLLGLNQVQEYIGAQESMDAYLLHVSTAEFLEPVKTAFVTLRDRETGEQGMAAAIDLF